ncbi:MAG: phytoene desaturase [Ignavibacteriae bacterium]|nr:phytoene desaturase [Ignavibacteriota bacterium]MCB9216156.1 phytoene desaturase [Ignavibacteria bacterium]
MRHHVQVIGAGLGGLSAAIHLRLKGYDVTIFEKNHEPGGKLSRRYDAGHYFDLGPTVLTMPFVLEELFKAAGERLEDHITLHPVEPTCRYYWSDGTAFDAWGEREKLLEEVARCFPEDVNEFRRFLGDIARLYEATKDVFLFSPFRGVREFFSLRNARLAPMLGSLGFTQTVHRSLERRFHSPKLIQFLDRFATYNGSSPYSAPATLNVIPHVELAFGAWYPEGGMYRIVEVLTSLAESLGVKIHLSSEVEGVGCEGKRITSLTVNGVRESSNIVISNVDALRMWKHLLDPAGLPIPTRLEREERSCSGFLMLATVEKVGERESHHSIFFSDHYRQEFNDLFETKSFPSEMTIYRSVSSVSDLSLTVEGEENWYLLVNAPARPELFANRVRVEKYSEMVLRRLEAFNQHPTVRSLSVMTPLDIEERYASLDGAIYGSASNSIFSAFMRQGNKVKGVENLYMVGGSVHPGGGIPLVLLSGKIVAQMVESL